MINNNCYYSLDYKIGDLPSLSTVHDTHQLPIGEKTHIKIVDVRGDKIIIYVNGIRYSEDMTDIARHTCSGALLVETGNNGVPTSFEIYNLFYQNLTPL